MRVIVISLIMAIAGAAAASPTATGAPAIDPCKGVLDAVTVGATRCRSPVALASTIAADAAPVVEAPMRDPALLPGELGFVAVASALVGGGAVAFALLATPAPAGSTDAMVQQGALWGGVGFLSLAGLVSAAAIGTWVFNPATGTLQLPIFDGEPR